jgi:hypothetical protein
MSGEVTGRQLQGSKSRQAGRQAGRQRCLRTVHIYTYCKVAAHGYRGSVVELYMHATT